MATSENELIDYILQAQKHGLADFEIKQNLLNAGWEAETVEKSFVKAIAQETRPALHPEQSALPEQPQTHPASPAAASVKPEISPIQASAAPVIEVTHDGSPKQAGKLSLKVAIGIIAVVVVLLAGAAYAYYNYVLFSPTKIWSKFDEAFTQNSKKEIYNSKFSMGYYDSGQVDEKQTQGLGIQLKDIKLEVEGDDYFNKENPDNPEGSAKLQYSFSSGNTKFSTGVEYKLKDNVLYVNIGDNPFLNLLNQGPKGQNGGKKVDWIKFDLNEIKKQSSAVQSQVKFYQNITSPNFKNDMQKIWEDAHLIKLDKYVGKESLNGVTTLHFKNSLDKQALKGMVNNYVDSIVKAMDEPSIKTEDVNYAKEIAAQLIDKISIKEFETWVGMKDLKLYRLHLAVNAPSVISLVNNLNSSA